MAQATWDIHSAPAAVQNTPSLEQQQQEVPWLEQEVGYPRGECHLPDHLLDEAGLLLVLLLLVGEKGVWGGLGAWG